MGAGSSVAAKAPPPSGSSLSSRAGGPASGARSHVSSSALEPSGGSGSGSSSGTARGVSTRSNASASSNSNGASTAGSSRSNKRGANADSSQVVGASSTKYAVDSDEDGSSSAAAARRLGRGGSEVDAQAKAESARLQKLALEGDKPTWREMHREYNADQGVNKPSRIEWSDNVAPTAPNTARTGSSKAPIEPINLTHSRVSASDSSSQLTAGSPGVNPAARARQDNGATAGANAASPQLQTTGPNSRIMAPPQIAAAQTKRATSPGSAQQQQMTTTVLAPSVLPPMKAAIEGPPPGYEKNQHRSHHAGGHNDSNVMATAMRTGGIADARGRPVNQFHAPYTPMQRPAPPSLDGQDEAERMDGSGHVPPSVRVGSSSGNRPNTSSHPPFPHAAAHVKGGPHQPSHSGQPPSFGGAITAVVHGSARNLLDKSKSETHEVKETSDVKRNRAQLPSKLTHAKPTTGDWLNKRYIVNNYILLDTLGTGSYGEVRMCKDRASDQLYAMKILNKDFLKKKKQGNTSETYEEDIRREIAIMKKLTHPNVLKLYEVLDDPNVNKLYLVLEYMKRGDLLHFLSERDAEDQAAAGAPAKRRNSEAFTPVNERELWIIFRQVVHGVKYLHQHNIVHGDIKPQNILMGEDGVIRIADFGISKMLADGERLSNAAGTPAFMSPELCSGAPSVSGQQADVWAIAAAMFMLRFGHPPFLAGSIVNLYNKIINDPLVFPHAIDPALQNLLEHMLEKDPEKRYTVDEVIRHPWLMQPPTTVVKSVQRRDNFGVWPPAPTYDKDERAAMEGPLKTANRDEMFSSILGNTSTTLDKDSKSRGSESKEEEEEIMATNWGLDVFEQVDDADFQSGSEDEEVDSVDDKSDGKAKSKTSDPSNYSSTQDIMATTGSKSDDAMSTIGSKTSVSSRHDMDSEEEQKRAQRFQKLSKPKVAPQAPPKQTTKQPSGDWSDSDDEEFKKVDKKAQKKSSAPSIFDTNIDAKHIGVGAPSAPKVGPHGNGRDRPPKLKVVRGDSVDMDTDEVVAENLTMDDFSSLMDTLSVPVPRSIPSTPNTPSPMILGSFEITEMQRNIFNGVGLGFHSEQGVRPNQEDRCVVQPTLHVEDATGNSYKYAGDDAEFFKKVSVAAIFDGHSGHGCADYLYEHLIAKIVASKDAFKTNLPLLIKQTFSSVDDEVCKHLRAEEDLSGSTGLLMIYNGRSNQLTVACVGDSMCILSRSGRAVRLHRLHRLDDEEECERVRRAGGSVLNRRVNGLLAISRAFGDTQFKDHEAKSAGSQSGQLVIAEPEVHSELVMPTTEFAVAASDGLWDVMEPQAVVDFVRKRIATKVDLQMIARELVNKALSQGSVDNVTAVIMLFHLHKLTPHGPPSTNTI